MQDLLEVIDNEPRVSHRVVAQNTGNEQKNVNELIRKYSAEFAEFGGVPFKTEGVSETELKQKENPDYRPNKTFYLNEPQATFLMTLLRNKPVVVAFKKKLVKAFFAMKQEREQVPNADIDVLEILRVLVQNQTIMIQQQQMMMERMEAYEKQPTQISTLSLTPEQLGKIRGAVNMATEAVLEYCFNDTETNVQQLVYKKLNNLLGTPSYIYIPASAFDEAMEILKSIELKHSTLSEQRKERDRNIRASINNDDFEFPQF